MNVQEADDVRQEVSAREAARARAPRAAALSDRLFDAVLEAPLSQPEKKLRLELNLLALDRWIEGTDRDVTEDEAAQVEALLR